jgi:hypothetical protein
MQPGGVVVVVLPHPCFNSTEVSRAVKKPGGLPGEDPKPYLMVEKYLGTGTTMGVAVPSQVTPSWAPPDVRSALST